MILAQGSDNVKRNRNVKVIVSGPGKIVARKAGKNLKITSRFAIGLLKAKG
jgi:hypothetical protein